MTDVNTHRHYRVVEQAIEYIYQHFAQQPSLAEIAAAVHMSEHHLQRVFSEWAGISPKRFLQFITKQNAIEALQHSANMLEASQRVGLSGSSRLHDLMVTCEAMTPGEIKSGGAGVLVEYGFVMTPFAEALLAWTERGICFLQFNDEPQTELLAELTRQWPHATLQVNCEAAQRWADIMFAKPLARGHIHLLLKGTNFQVKVWEAMLNSDPGQQLSYGQVSQMIDAPKAARAVGTALASNTIGYLIPCHRVIRSSGELGHYRWRLSRKAAMLAWEQATTA